MPCRRAQAIQSTSSLLYFVSALCGYGAAAFVPSLTLDRPLFYRELADGCYSPLVYYLSKFIEEAFLCVFTSLLFSVIVFFGVKLQVERGRGLSSNSARAALVSSRLASPLASPRLSPRLASPHLALPPRLPLRSSRSRA